MRLHFLENESKLCECRANLFFGGKGYANLSVPTHRLSLSVWFHERECRYIHIHIAMSCDYCFLSTFDASINFMRCFPLIIKKRKKKKEKKEKTKTLSPWIDLVNLKVLFLRNSTELDFLCDCVIFILAWNQQFLS